MSKDIIARGLIKNVETTLNERINNLDIMTRKIVDTLPTTDISTKIIYMVPKETTQEQNVYDEYINTNGTVSGWELIGNTQIDLTNCENIANKIQFVTGGTPSHEKYPSEYAMTDFVYGRLDHYVSYNKDVEVVVDNILTFEESGLNARAKDSGKNINDIALKPSKITSGSNIELVDNTEYSLTDVSELTLTYPSGDFEVYMHLNFVADGAISVTIPSTTTYIGKAPVFTNAETWEISIKNGVMIA